jgi:uncharacterized protein (TIGR03790 family)
VAEATVAGQEACSTWRGRGKVKLVKACRAKLLAAVLLFAGLACAQGPENVLVVINDNSPLSRSIGEYYARRRGVPMRNLCRLHTTTEENIPRADYNTNIAGFIAAFLRQSRLTESILYIVTTAGVPLRIPGPGSGMEVELAAVDSELTLLYSDMHSGKAHRLRGSIPNPFFGQKETKFSHPQFPIYLVTRLAAYDFDGVKGIIDRSLQAANRGKFVIDLHSSGDGEGDNWLRDAALLLPKERTVVDESSTVLYDQSDVIGYAAWGSNDKHRHRRFLGFHWLPGAIMTEFVSTNGRTFARPPDNWNISDWTSRQLWFAGSPQTLTADYILEGVTGASGHTDEPYLIMTPRPDLLLPAYYKGRNLAESYYLAIRGLSWQNIVVGDPLCSLGKP